MCICSHLSPTPALLLAVRVQSRFLDGSLFELEPHSAVRKTFEECIVRIIQDRCLVNSVREEVVTRGSYNLMFLRGFFFKFYWFRSHRLLQDDDLDEYLVPPTVWTLYENKFKPSDAYDSEENLLLAEVTEAKQGSPLTVDNYKPRLELLNQIEDVHVNYEFQDCFVVGPTLTPRPDLVDRDVGGFKCQIPVWRKCLLGWEDSRIMGFFFSSDVSVVQIFSCNKGRRWGAVQHRRILG